LPTPPNAADGTKTAAAGTSLGTGATSALAFVDQLESATGELSSYAADANTVGRDTQQLRAYFERSTVAKSRSPRR